MVLKAFHKRSSDLGQADINTRIKRDKTTAEKHKIICQIHILS
jgi:hypothetical protein